MKTFLERLSWVGLLIVAVGLPQSFSSSWTFYSTGSLGSGAGYVVALSCGGLGFFLGIVGGVLARPKYFGLVLVVLGLLYISSFYGEMLTNKLGTKGWDVQTLFLVLLPGIVGVGEGLILMRWNRKRPG